MKFYGFKVATTKWKNPGWRENVTHKNQLNMKVPQGSALDEKRFQTEA